MKDNNKKTSIIIFIIMLIVLILLDLAMYSKFIYNERSDYIDDFSDYDYPLEKEKIQSQDGNIEIVQTITGTGNNLEGITIGFNKEFRTYNESNIEIEITEHETRRCS